MASVLGTSAGRTYGAEVTYSYGYRAEFSDNIRRVPVNPEHDMVNVLDAGLTYQDRTRTVDLRLAPTVEYLNYRKNSFDDEFRVNLDSSLLWTISPERLTWTVEDTAREVRVNPAQPDTPTNTALANLFNTGPDLYLRAGSVNTLQLGARYGNVYVGDTNTDNQRNLGYARWLYQSSPLTQWSLNLEEERVEFDDDIANLNFRRQDAFLRVQTRSTDSNLGVDVGHTRIARDRSEEVDANLARLSWDRRLNSETQIGLVGESSLSDTGSDLAATAAAANNPAQTPTVSQNLVAQDVFRAKRAEIFLNRIGSRVTTNVRAFGRDLTFFADPINDRDERGGEISLAYRWSAANSVDAFYSYVRAEYRNQILVDTDKTAGLRFLRLITRNVSFSIQLQQDQRNSTDPSREFVDNRVVLSVVYNSGIIPRRQ